MNKTHLVLFIILFLIFKIEAQTSVLSIADSLYQYGNYKDALKELEKVKPPTYNILIKQASIYQKTNNYSKAIDLYTRALQKKESLKIKRELGNSYLAQGNANKTIDIYEEILEKDTTNLLLKFDLAKLYTKEYRKNDAIPLLEALIKADSLNPGYYYELGKIYKNKGALGFMKSGNYFLDTYRRDSTHLKSIYELSKFYEQLKFKDSTTIFIDKGLRINPKSINFNQLKAKEAYGNKDYQTTLIYLKILEELQFKTIFTYKLFGLTYMKLEDYDNAEKYFKKALKKNYSDASLHYNMGILKKLQGDLKAAEMNFMISIMNLKPDVYKQYYEIGLINLEQNKLQKSVANFKKSYENNSNNYYALFQLALASDDFYKDKTIALKHFENYIKRFDSKDKDMTAYATKRLREMKKEFFMEGVKIE